MNIETTRHRYPRRAVTTEYAYSVVGMAFTFIPLGLTTPLPAVTGILAALGALFLAFGVRTLIRHNTVFELSDMRIAMTGGRRAEVRWEELSGLKLSYFSTKRDRGGGWMQLRLKSGGSTIRIDSTVEGFDDLVVRAVRAARTQGLEFEPTTLQNLASIGLLDEAQGTSHPEGVVRP